MSVWPLPKEADAHCFRTIVDGCKHSEVAVGEADTLLETLCMVQLR
jgi:hypothetical protein